MGVHSDTVPLICGVCLKVFPDVIKLSTHVKSNHWPLTNGDFSCDVCGRPYSNKSKMSRHRKIHGLEVESIMSNGISDRIHEPTKYEHSPIQTETELTCEICADLTFDNWEALCNHRRLVHGLFPCDLCNKCYGRTSHLWKHVNRVHKGHEDVTCRYCMKTSASKDHLAAHIAKIHRYEPDSRLDIISSTNYKQTTIDEGEGVHHCDKCNKGFHKRYLLRRHMKGCQNYRKDPGALLTRCRACERIFKDRASLQKHIENHHSEYTCHLCDETVISKLGIMTHNRLKHMEHPDLTCENVNCKKLFRTKGDLESHRKDHKFHNNLDVCDFCGDTVDNKLKLKMHVLSLHRNEIGVSCGVCLIPMKDPKDLKKHVEDEHDGVLLKPNTCQVCGKQYASKWKAFDHTKKCHGKVFRTCKQCLAVFTTDKDIRHHYEHVHNISKGQLAGFEKRLDDFDHPDVAVKEEPEDYDDDEGILDDEVDYKRRRTNTDTHDCDMCPEIFLNHETLTDHCRNVHNKEPQSTFKKIKLDTAKRKMRDRENFECEHCGKQFCTKALYWNHSNICTRRSGAKEEPRSYPTSILEAHLKNNNKIKKEPRETSLASNLNIPDFNLFEDINMQLSEQKPIPNLMPLSQLKLFSSIKCSRKDSRKVYDESTNTECTCEVCGKPWPAKKHLWQHLIRFHRNEAAVTCGVCLKFCRTYEALAEHLAITHESILTCEGNNFTCKTCGRYHNARSKLLLHMSIHINSTGIAWCRKCEQSFESEEKLTEHTATCDKHQVEYEDHSNDRAIKIDDDDKGSLIGDEASMIGDGEFSDHRVDESNFDNSEDFLHSSVESGSEDVDNEADSRTISRATGEVSCPTESEEERDSDDSADTPIKEDEEMSTPEIEKEKSKKVLAKEELNDENNSVALEKESKEIADESDDDGPPVLSPIVPLSIEDEPLNCDDSVRHTLSPMISLIPKVEPKEENLSDLDNDSSDKPISLVPNMEYYESHSNSSASPSDEEPEDGIVEDLNEELDDEDSRIHVVNPDDEYHSDDEDSAGQVIVEGIYIEQSDAEEAGEEEGKKKMEMEQEEEDQEDGVEISDLNGTVLMVAKDADGNQILIQKNVSEMNDDDDDSMQAVTGFIYEDDNEYDFRGFEVEQQESEGEAMEEGIQEDQEDQEEKQRDEEEKQIDEEGREKEEEEKQESEKEIKEMEEDDDHEESYEPEEQKDNEDGEDCDPQDSNTSAKSNVSMT